MIGTPGEDEESLELLELLLELDMCWRFFVRLLLRDLCNIGYCTRAYTVRTYVHMFKHVSEASALLWKGEGDFRHRYSPPPPLKTLTMTRTTIRSRQ